MAGVFPSRAHMHLQISANTGYLGNRRLRQKKKIYRFLIRFFLLLLLLFSEMQLEGKSSSRRREATKAHVIILLKAFFVEPFLLLYSNYMHFLRSLHAWEKRENDGVMQMNFLVFEEESDRQNVDSTIFPSLFFSRLLERKSNRVYPSTAQNRWTQGHSLCIVPTRKHSNSNLWKWRFSRKIHCLGIFRYWLYLDTQTQQLLHSQKHGTTWVAPC